MPEYDLQNPTDVDIMRGNFDMYSHDEWDDYIALAEEREIGYKNINILKSSSRKAGMGKFLSPKVLKWVLGLIDQLDEEVEEEGLKE